MLLAANKHAMFQVVIAADAPAAVRHAADELQRYMDRLALAFPSVRTEAPSEGPLPERAVLIGDSAARRQLVPEADLASLAGESYVIQARGPHLLVAGGSEHGGRGTLYGVYDLLERLGVRWWTPGEETVPSLRVLELPELNVRVEPPLIYRATWYRHAMDGDFQARRRLSAGTMGPVHLRERHGGMVRFAADASGHTYEGLVPTDKYFDQHPEYFSEVKGQRLRHMNQLCPTHPAVAEIAAETARRWLDATPGCNLVSVTQNDWGNWCTCPTCRPLLERTGAPSGPMLHLANQVARHLEKTHPHALVDTFAYAWSEVAPRNIEAHPQVLIRIAPIGNCFGHPIRSCPANERCRTAVQSWSKIARHLFVWHYVTDFFHYLAPFPNLPSLEDDIRFYLGHGVKGIFMQGNGTSLGGDMPELKAYLISKLLFDPQHTSAANVREEFITGYYRGAAPAVREYLDTFEKAFADAGPNVHLHLYRSLWDNEANYLRPEALKRARTALARGRKLADGHDVAERLERLRASLDYTELFYHERPKRRELGGDRIKCRSSRHRQRLARRFFGTMERHRVTHYAEDLGRYTTLGMLRRAWLDSAGRHEAIALAGGGSRAVVVPAIGGRIIAFGPEANDGGASGGVNYLGESTPGTFGYPCTGGYEEYALRPHQSPGFCERYEVTRRGGSVLELRAELETGATIVRRIEFSGGDATTGELAVHTRMLNGRDAALPGCLRAHLEIDLATPPPEVEVYFLRGGRWQRVEFKDAAGWPAAPGGSWYDADVPEGWLFWSEPRRRGLWQRWSHEGAGAVFLGTIPAEPTTLALDLAHGRYNEPIAPGGEQVVSHRFMWVMEKPDGAD